MKWKEARAVQSSQVKWTERKERTAGSRSIRQARVEVEVEVEVEVRSKQGKFWFQDARLVRLRCDAGMDARTPRAIDDCLWMCGLPNPTRLIDMV
jgi:hypothetical protein